ncbi:MAG: tetraacyldisaccharide 4'-kinase [Bacteroidetes bacterium]|nr:tetraacyldisaccharide 4'-kinase [Bacteroidota bacterium]
MIKLLLYPFAWLYGFGVSFRNRMYDLGLLKSKEFDVPVISIGNITVGGTGKTPHIEYLVNLLHEKFAVATLSRGYKRKTKGFRYVETSSTVLEVGDEPLQIKNKFQTVTVSVCENRVVGAEKLLDLKNAIIPDVVLLDDAFQHRRITPGINILLIDYNRQIKEDTLLPVGRLRESVTQMRRANVIIFTKCPDKITPIMRRILMNDVALKPYQELFFTTLNYQKLEPVFSAKKLGDDFYEERTYSSLIVTGIASPKPIHKYLKQFSEKVEFLAYPDHYNFSKADISTILQKFNSINSEKKIIITTEKDAMRLKDQKDLTDEFKNALYYLPVKVKFLQDEGKAFNKKILNYVGENKSNRELHKRKNKRQS